MKSFIITLVVMVIALSLFGDAVRFVVQVIDEQTTLPVPGVEVSGGFKTDRGLLAKDRYAYEYKQYLTDESGMVKIRGTSNCGQAGWAVNRAVGYYYPVHGSGIPLFRKKNFFGVWQPDNLVVTVRLQRVERPVPLWVKRIGNFASDTCREDLFAKGGDRIAFDFLVGDWLPPVGHGEVADAEFVRMPHEDLGEGENDGIKGKAYRDTMSVKFIGADNGLLEMHPLPSATLRIRTAPEEGYKPDYLRWEGRDVKLKWDSNYGRDKCFCFRIRTRRDERGNVVEAYYGKIYGDFKIACKNNPYVPIASVCMFYYLNPTSLDRNLEWDMETNLCTNPGDVGHSVGDRQP